MSSQGAKNGSIFTNTGTGVSWINPSNAQTSNNVRATATLGSGANSSSKYLRATGFGFAIPPNAEIKGILVEIEKREGNLSASSITDSSVLIVKNGTASGNDKAELEVPWSTTDTYVSYGGETDLWGLSWKASDINSSSFGVQIKATGIFVPTQSERAEIDHIRITVYYDDVADSSFFGTNT